MDKNVKIIEITDDKFPKSLKEAVKNLITSAEIKRLYYKGNWCPEIFENCLAVVGSRHLTSYGKKATEQIVTEVALAGVTIVSGFMYGGDEAAHSATVKCGGKTIAVMPCGINRIHPESQKDLYEEILKKDGLIISEYEGLAQPQQWTYVQRNRIVAGLCKAILVTEATENSGTLITAGYAKKFGKKIFALPGQITSGLSKGPNRLIKEGAEIVTEAKDILDFYKISRSKANLPAGKKLVLGSSLEQKIIEQLQREPMKADELSRLFLLPSSQIGTTLTLMQLKGFINLDNGKYHIN
jgi:DNA processing protein